MKKTIIGFAVVMAMVASVSVYANVQDNEQATNTHNPETTQIASQGAHCSGTVGCGCPGFSPITNGDVWQQAYCKYCNHKKSVHK